MPSTYPGNAGAITAHQAPSVVVPVDADPPNAASVSNPFKTLADYLAYLQAHALLDTDNPTLAWTDVTPDAASNWVHAGVGLHVAVAVKNGVSFMKGQYTASGAGGLQPSSVAAGHGLPAAARPAVGKTLIIPNLSGGSVWGWSVLAVSVAGDLSLMTGGLASGYGIYFDGVCFSTT